MKALKQWFSNHSLTAHGFVSAWITADALWYTSKDFKDYIWGIYSALPRSVHGFIAGVVVPALVYWQVKRRLTVSATVSPGSSETVLASATVQQEKK